MRPQKLSLKNFMPFRATGGQAHEVDFSPLELFAITGPMASGKSALIDAIVWCLYGRTARYGVDSKGVIAAGEQTCEVALDFTVGERWFRAVRRTGRVTDSGLSEREGDEWIQDRSGSALLTKRIEDLLGLDFDSFTKTVILPQGRYGEFLTSEPKKRRELLEKILELGVYTRVRTQARDVAKQAETRADTLRETLAQYADLSPERLTRQQEELAELEHRIEHLAQQEQVLHSLAQQVDRVAGLRSRLAELQADLQVRAQEKEEAKKKADAITVELAELTHALARFGQEREALGYDAARHTVVKQAVAHLGEWAVADREAGQKSAEHSRVQEEVEALAQQRAVHVRQLEQARSQHQTHTATFERHIAEAGDVATLTEKLSAAKRWKELCQQQQELVAQLDSLRHTHAASRHTLERVKRQETLHEQTVRELQATLERAKEDERQKRQLIAEAESLDRELHEAAEAEKRVQAEAEVARAALAKAEHTAQHIRRDIVQAQGQEQAARAALEDTQRQHEAAHLRETLHIGDACPVCRTIVSDIPAAQDAESSLKELQEQLAGAQQTTEQKRTRAQEASAAVAAQQARREAAEQEVKERGRVHQQVQDRFVSRFPAHASPAEALKALQTQHKELNATLKDLEAQTASAEQETRQRSHQRETAQQEEARLGEALRGATDRLDTGKPQLAALRVEIAAFLAPNEDPEHQVAHRRTRVMQAEQHMKAAEEARRQAETALGRLTTAHIQKEGEATLLASEHQAALQGAEREARAVRECLGLAHDAVLPPAEDLAGELTGLSHKQARHVDLSQREDEARASHGQAERQAAALQADQRARTRMLEEARHKRQQAQNQLDRERDTLRTAIARDAGARRLPDAGEDGANIKPQLETLRGHRISLQEHRGRLEAEQAEAQRRWREKEQEEEKLRTAQTEQRLASDLHGLLGSAFSNFLSRGAIEALMRDASVHLQGLTHGRYTFDIAYRNQAIHLQIIDHENQRRARPAHSLSGGETFLASLAIALALSQGFRTVATGRAATTSTECLILDEGFGTLDREGVQMVTETLQELRGEEGRMVGIITHVEEVAAAMPAQLEIHKGSRSSLIAVAS